MKTILLILTDKEHQAFKVDRHKVERLKGHKFLRWEHYFIHLKGGKINDNA